MNPRIDRPLGLALGGGAGLGAVHVGVLRALAEAGLAPDVLAGTSVGALVAALYAFGVPLDELESLAQELDWSDVGRPTLSRSGLFSNERLGRLVERRIGGARVEDAPFPLRLIATDIEKGRAVVISAGDVLSAVRASACIPGLFTPVAREGALLVDGGLVDNLPVAAARDAGARTVIAADLSHSRWTEAKNIVGVLMNSMRAVMRLAGANGAREADLLIAPDLGDYSPLDTRRGVDLVGVGYEAARTALSTLAARAQADPRGA